MKKIITATFTAAFLSICYSCTQQPKEVADTNKIPFTIDPMDRKIVLPVQLNDSIIANLTFDSGTYLGALNLDSTFCNNHSTIIPNIEPDTIEKGGVAWSKLSVPISVYSKTPTIKIGNTDLSYSSMNIYDWKWYMNAKTDGMFNIPLNDTTHVWEFNFEHNYMKIHLAQNFRMPSKSFIAPMVNNRISPFNIKLPIRLKCTSGDTLTLNRTFLVDTGMPWDIALMCKAKELPFFNRQKDAVWTKDTQSYYRHYVVEGTLFDQFEMNSLRIYTFDYPNSVPEDYLVGQNFLKRFNVFFDMKNQQIGLQPIPNFQRIINPLHKRFHLSFTTNPKGKIIVSKVADYEKNYYKTARFKEGDEVITLNGIPYKEITDEKYKELEKLDTFTFGIKRKGKAIDLIVNIDKSEIQGD